MILTIIILIASTFIKASYIPHDSNNEAKKKKRHDYHDNDNYSYDGKFYLGIKEYTNNKYYNIVYELSDGQIQYGNNFQIYYPSKNKTSSSCVGTTVTTTQYNTTTKTSTVLAIVTVADNVFGSVETSTIDAPGFAIAQPPKYQESSYEEPTEEPSTSSEEIFESSSFTFEEILTSTSAEEEDEEGDEGTIESSSTSRNLSTTNTSDDYYYYKRDIEQSYNWFTLNNGVIKDSNGKIGEIVANHQFQYDYPIQPDSLFTRGFSIITFLGIRYLALNGNTRFWNSAVNDFGIFKIYDKPINENSKPINLVIIDPF